MSGDDTDQLLSLMNANGKREIERICRRVTITSEALSNVILAGRIGELGPFSYQCHFREISPDSLNPTKEDLAAVVTSGVGRLEGRAQRTLRKMGQIFVQRRLLSVHLFYHPSHRLWHMFHFDQRDYRAYENHWRFGPHIHYSQHSLNRAPLADIWKKVHGSPPEFPRSLHVRYDYHHNRQWQRRA